jgi:periplasmic protein TonB
MARTKFSLEWTAAAIGSIALHALWLTHDANAMHLPKATPSEVLITAEELPRPLVEQTQPEAAPEENSRPEPVHKALARPNAEPRAALPTAAQAGRTLTAPDAPGASDVADFSMVQGAGSEYAGGTTSSIGTSATAVRGAASSTKDTGPRLPSSGNQEAVAGPDLRRQATPSGSNWNCSSLFPSDPDAGDYATVLIAVTVLPSGKPKSAAIIRDPGHGFAAAARACAMLQSYSSALDRQGNPIVATTPPITVRFTR